MDHDHPAPFRFRFRFPPFFLFSCKTCGEEIQKNVCRNQNFDDSKGLKCMYVQKGWHIGEGIMWLFCFVSYADIRGHLLGYTHPNRFVHHVEYLTFYQCNVCVCVCVCTRARARRSDAFSCQVAIGVVVQRVIVIIKVHSFKHIKKGTCDMPHVVGWLAIVCITNT